MFTLRSFRDLDWTLLILTLIICAVGVLQIYSATQASEQSNHWWKQVLYIGAGLVVFYLISQIDYHTLVGQSPVMYIIFTVILFGLLILSRVVLGAKRWVSLGAGFKLQPSEFMKLVLILFVARYISELKSDSLSLRELLKLCLLVLFPFGLVCLQPDLGTSLCYLPILAVGILLAGLSRQQALAIVMILALVVPIGWFALKDYQKARLTSFMDPALDPQGSGYQVMQSKIAVGSGGMWGLGVTRGMQIQLRFLPFAHTDFIFAAFAEEHGFVGVVTVLGLYFLLLMQILQNAQTASDRAGTAICMGVGALLLFHVLENAGMVAGLMPVAGIPLPLMSYGGSSILSFFLMLGLVNNVRLRRFLQ
ncbi:rod shape-determining protein RodA [Bryobacter aggregatus]|uniref:rod shape-determining protein RodA n=1 Tax=Bryobacter aggregatus TaxID=360054 RepID=UPI0004E24AC7|nr:rod shape-determining protein RodA [Bryobacter aggregatus]